MNEGAGQKRRSARRDAIREVIQDAQGPLSVEEILDAARKKVPGLGTATVYRNLNLFAEEGLIHAVHLGGETPRYEWAEERSKRHSHFVCDTCERSYCLDDASLKLNVNLPEGFDLDYADLCLHGRCPACK